MQILAPIYQSGGDTSNGTFSLRVTPYVERDPTPCKHYIFLSFRRGRGQLLVREHGTERVDVPGHPLPEGALCLLVAL